ncbi:MAG: LD-carboxypeptidase [Deltaproteobacteria bacterium]|nr:LD-carboxypeptidase [Deltaproteobacteria bacterium]
MIKPSRLSRGDSIGIISPAGPINRSHLEIDLHFLKTKGFKVHVAPHVYDRQEYLAGKDEDRLSDLHHMFQATDIKAVFCSRGGYGSMRLLDRIDYDLIRKNPKILVGYSDITALLTAIFKKTGLITFHGPMVKGLSSLPETTWQNLVRIISSQQPPATIPLEGHPLHGGKATGPIMGGNLSLICRLPGTPFMPNLKGCILFIEDRGEALYRVDRMLTHLRLAGSLEGIKGLIVGQFLDCGDPAAIDHLIKERFASMNIPMAAGFPLGHGPDNTTLPLGILAELDTDVMALSFLASAVI